MGYNLKIGNYYKEGSSIFKLLKVNYKRDGSISLDLFCYYKANRHYVQNVPISYFKEFLTLDGSLVEALYE